LKPCVKAPLVADDATIGIGEVDLLRQPALDLGRQLAPGRLAGRSASSGDFGLVGIDLGVLRGLRGDALALQLVQQLLDAPGPSRRVGQLGGELVAARLPEQTILARIDLAGLGDRAAGLLAQALDSAVGLQRRVGVKLGAIDGDRAGPQQPRPRAQPENLAEQIAQRLLVARAKPSDRRMIRRQVGSDHTRGNVLDAAPLDLTRRPDPDRVAEQQQRHHQPGIVRWPALPISAVLAIERGEIELLDRAEHKPRKMPGRQPVTQHGGNKNS
jgi:hypothetical protein